MLTNVITESSRMYATANNAVAESEVKEFPLLSPNIRNTEVLRVWHKLYNIASGSTADTLSTDYPIQIDDVILIRLADGTVTELAITGIGGSGPYTVDTSSVTAGETPDNVFMMNEILINDVVQPEDKSRRYTNLNGSYLEVASIYNKTDIYASRNIITTVKLPVLNNEVSEIDTELYDLVTKVGSTVHTDDTSPVDTVSVGGAAAGSNSAYLMFDGDSTTNGFTATCASDGSVDIYHTYAFDTPTTCYYLEMDTVLASEAPQEYYVYGSYDNSVFDELLHITQVLGDDNLTFKREFDGTKFNPYKYYKIHVVKGPADGTVSAAEYRLLSEV